MLGDANDIEPGTTLGGDVCIVGGGPAGIAIARELASTKLNVILLESGGLTIEPEAQELNVGTTEGAARIPLRGGRQRVLGGSSSVWGGLSRPFDARDFQPRGWLPYSGWPIEGEALDPYYRRAQDLLGLGPTDYRQAPWKELTNPGPLLSEQGFVRLPIRVRPMRLGIHYREELRKAPRLRVILHATVTELVPEAEPQRVRYVQVSTLSGIRFSVAARFFVCACGGIENARLLLLSSKMHPDGAGNMRGLVGRFFMEHPAAKPLGLLVAEEKLMRLLTHRLKHESVVGRSFLSFSDSVLERERLLQHAVSLGPTGETKTILKIVRFLDEQVGSKLVDDDEEQMISFIQALSNQSRLVVPFLMECEQVPNPESRVTLTDDLDALGQRRVSVKWQLSERERDTFQRVGDSYATVFGRLGLGRLKMTAWLRDPKSQWQSRVVPGHHHSGTTRMATNPTKGVVDPDCGVFGINNLFVAGSSVFPTASHQTPLLTLVALAIRLADHLVQVSERAT